MPPSPDASLPAPAVGRQLALPGLVLLCWALAVRHLASDWTLNEQYHYGWTVPPLALYLLRLRLERPPSPLPFPWPGLITAALLLVALAEALLLPVQEANADWRLLGWILTALACAATLLAFAQAGGWPWLVHLAFPALFFFTAVPWPRPVEIEVMQGLMKTNAQLAAEMLRWFGLAAEVQGNLIRLPSGVVGVDEACSGIRSLQGSLMATLFVGEIFDLSRWRRVFLLLAGAGWALVTNVGRTVFLAWTAGHGGDEALDLWHDSAGLWVLAACVTGVTFTGWLLGRSRKPRPAKPAPAPVAPRMLSDWPFRLSAPFPAALCGILLILTAWAGSEAWYRLQERSVTRVADWHFEQPSSAARFESLGQSRFARGELRYDLHSGGRWRDLKGRLWVAHYFRWNRGRNGIRSILMHDPRVCLVSSGKEWVQTLPVLPHSAGDVQLLFDCYHFREQGRDVYVFNCVAEDAPRGPASAPEGTQVTMTSRLEAVRAGKRNLGQRRLEVAVWGAADAASARQAFQTLLRDQIRVEPIMQ